MGKKYIIEIDETPYTQNGKSLYRAVNFSSLVFDSYGLSLLEDYKEPEPEPKPEIRVIRVGDVVETEAGSKVVVIQTYSGIGGIMGFGIDRRGRKCVEKWVAGNNIQRVISHYCNIERIMEELKDL